ncbi:MAG TPA: tetratricopeptide repeat protein [Isosphaeraceae bacterium]|nr:tetratricopeptide repeat protein [Isosphaeraceae bacterium]
MRVDARSSTDRGQDRGAIGRGRSRRFGSWACGVAVVIALAGAPAIRAGSILLTPEWLEKSGSTTEAGDTSRGLVELDQATRSFQGGDFDACLRQLGAAVQAHPELPPAHALFARLAIESDHASLIRPALERAIAEDPEHPEVFLLFGELALREGRLTDAALHFEKAAALARAPRWTAQPRRRFEQLGLQGRAAVAEGRGDWKAAKVALDGWLELEPANTLARQRLGKALFHLGERKAAYQELERAAKADTALEPAAVSMGWLYTQAGDLKKAQEWMDYAVQVAPDSLAVRIGLAAWLLEQGRADEAQDQAATAAKLDPRSVGARRLLGLVARARKELSRSEPIFQAMAAEWPGDAWVRNQLALVLAEQSDEAKRRQALELAELGARQSPHDADTLATLGTVYYRLGRLDEAEKLLQAVVDSGQGSSDAAYILARIRADRGHAEAAPALLKAALAAPGLFLGRDDARQWLDRLALASQSAPRR